ncbi:MAG: CAP domain-containing protein [Burkholderiales bacterium]|nr:CAP domain-containing protein [Burkholderiales bacterium]
MRSRIWADSRRVLSFLLFLGLSLDAAAGDLYADINRLRAGAGDCVAAYQLPPLRPQAALERVARSLARGDEMQHALTTVGYRATRSSALWLMGDGVRAQAPQMLARRGSCEKLQDAAVTEIGIYQDARQVWIVMAAPFAPSVGQSEEAAGQHVLELVNQFRAAPRRCGSTAFNAARPVRWNTALAGSSQRHAEEMARYNYFSHSGRDGSEPADRVLRAGYRYRATGENIAAGQMNPEDVMAAWIKSPGHCANLMNPAYTEMGVAFAVDPRSSMGVYWTQTFGRPR